MEARAVLLAEIRSFFADRKVMEVETPVLSQAGNSDPNIHNISTAATRISTIFRPTAQRKNTCEHPRSMQ